MGPLDAHRQPIKAQAGATFRAWVRRLRRLGYRVDWRELRACDYGAPTTRKRLWWRGVGRPVVWPEPTHGPKDSPAVLSGKLAVSDGCGMRGLDCPGAVDFRRSKPLAEATQRRIAEGIRRYVLGREPFIVRLWPQKHSDFVGRIWAVIAYPNDYEPFRAGCARADDEHHGARSKRFGRPGAYRGHREPSLSNGPDTVPAVRQLRRADGRSAASYDHAIQSRHAGDGQYDQDARCQYRRSG
ncbi:MAG: DNA cytosine methyltransferase [Bilophila wadsworthia]